MGFRQAVETSYGKYADFQGRAPRSEYWFFVLANFLVVVAVGLICGLFGGQSMLFVGVGLVVLLVFLPSLAAQVRRPHETNASGWRVLLGFIPYVGGFIMVVWFCIRGTAGENRFGPDPLNPHTLEAFD